MTMPDPAPVIFAGHGHPIIALRKNAFAESLSALGRRIEKPRAVLVVSAHWLTRSIFVSSSERPGTIHDFGNFDPGLFEIEYPCPGSPVVADEILELLIGLPVESVDRGLDHGAWQVLMYLFPEANIPILQISLDMTLKPADHCKLARMLAPLRDRGILILASGNICHNLYELNWNDENAPVDPRIKAFDAWVKQRLNEGDIESLSNFQLEQNSQYSVPTIDHYLPFLYAAALRQEHEKIEYFYEGFNYRTLSMRSFIFGQNGKA